MREINKLLKSLFSFFPSVPEEVYLLKLHSFLLLLFHSVFPGLFLLNLHFLLLVPLLQFQKIVTINTDAFIRAFQSLSIAITIFLFTV
jgi:hypothetical protein